MTQGLDAILEMGRVSGIILPRLASNRDPPDLSFLSSRDYNPRTRPISAVTLAPVHMELDPEGSWDLCGCRGNSRAYGMRGDAGEAEGTRVR
jgi:hypothetical protein